MSKTTHGTSWVLSLFFLGLTAGLAGTASALAADGKKADDPKAEADKAAKEDADEIANRLAGKKGLYQRKFHGTFLLLSDPSEQTNPDVVGSFVTDEADMHPNQTYLVKVDGGNKQTLETLKHLDTKKVWAQGKLRVDNKYLIVSGVTEPAPGLPVKEQRTPGGI